MMRLQRILFKVPVITALYLAASAHGQVAIPQLQGVVVQSSAAAAADGEIIEYQYRIEHAGDELSVIRLELDLSSNPSRLQLSADGLGNPQGFLRAINLASTPAVPAVSAVMPQPWLAAVDVEGDLAWFSSGAPLEPGGLLEPVSLVSPGLPGIRELSVTPDVWEYTPNIDDPDLDVPPEDVLEAVASARLVLRTLGPVAPPAEFVPLDFLDEVLHLRDEARELGWIRPVPAAAELDALLESLRSELSEGRLSTARGTALNLAANAETAGCAGFSCDPSRALTAEARALLAINLRYLAAQLPSNAPPIARAGADLRVECSALAGTAVVLDGSASSDPDGDPLQYTWSGAFGQTGGATPTLVLPLGSSEIALTVSDVEYTSEPDVQSVTVAARVEGFEPPLTALVAEPAAPPPPERAFNQGRTLPLRLRLFCEQAALQAPEVAAPQIVALLREGEALPLETINLDAGQSNDSGNAFRSAGGSWAYNLSTADLTTGTYQITIAMPDGSRYRSQFVLR